MRGVTNLHNVSSWSTTSLDMSAFIEPDLKAPHSCSPVLLDLLATMLEAGQASRIRSVDALFRICKNGIS